MDQLSLETFFVIFVLDTPSAITGTFVRYLAESSATRMSSALQIVGSKQNISTNFVSSIPQEKTEICDSGTSADPISRLLEGLRIKDSSNSTSAGLVPGANSPRELRDLLDKMQMLLATVPRGLLPGRLRRSLFPKLLVLDLNGLLLDRIKVNQDDLRKQSPTAVTSQPHSARRRAGCAAIRRGAVV